MNLKVVERGDEAAPEFQANVDELQGRRGRHCDEKQAKPEKSNLGNTSEDYPRPYILALIISSNVLDRKHQHLFPSMTEQDILIERY